MKQQRRSNDKSLSETQKARDQAIRQRYASRPSLAELQESGDFTPVIKQGEQIALMQFAAKLKHYRTIAELSLSDLAERSGIDKSAISRLETGLAENPTIGTLERLARSVGKRLKIELVDDQHVERKSHPEGHRP